MNAHQKLALPALGTIIHGGHFHGVFQIGDELWGEVTSPRAEGDLSGMPWLPKREDLPGARSDFDGWHNTIAMENAGSPLAKAVRALRINGFDDWYIPARGGLLLQWANLGELRESEDFEAAWYWSSTQFARNFAFLQYFDYGSTNSSVKSWEGGRGRAVRRFRIE